MCAVTSDGGRHAGLTVACTQWLATPGAPEANLDSARCLISRAASAGADLVVLPEMWVCGYDPGSLASDAQLAAEAVPGPRADALAHTARQHSIWLFAGSVPERFGDLIYNTALVFDRDGNLATLHRKVHLYGPTMEPALFAQGDRLTSFSNAELGHVGVLICFDGDFPEAGLTLAAKGVDLVIMPSAYEWGARRYWDVHYPAAAIAGGQWWIMANQCGSTTAGTLLGASRVISPSGRIAAEACRAEPGQTPEPELLLCRIEDSAADLDSRRFAAMLRHSRRPEVYQT